MQIVVSQTLTHFTDTNPKQSKTLLILHGWGHSSKNWETVISLLDKNYRYIALDLPSFGNTQNLPSPSGVPEYTTFTHQFISKLNLKSVSLLGHSFGGQIAVDFSLKYPKMVEQLILLSPTCIRQPSPKTKLLSSIKKIFPFAGRFGQLFHSSDYTNSSPIQKKVLSTILTQDFSNKLVDIIPNTHVIWGSEDKEIPYSGKVIAESVPNSQLHIIYSSGHNPHVTHPQKLTSIINEILC